MSQIWRALQIPVAVLMTVTVVVFGGRWAADFQAHQANINDYWLVDIPEAETRNVRVDDRPVRLCVWTCTQDDARELVRRYWIGAGIDATKAAQVSRMCRVQLLDINKSADELLGYAHMFAARDGIEAVVIHWTDTDGLWHEVQVPAPFR